MKITQLTKLALVIFTLSGFVACSSTGEDAAASESQTASSSSSSGNSQSAAEAAAAAAAAAEERMRRSALATRVFYFDFDVSEFRGSDRDVLNYHARELAANPSKRIRLEGHADERGSREYNLALGERRAKAVADYLAIQGISRARIEVVSYGEERPVALRSNSADYALNRRVELK